MPRGTIGPACDIEHLSIVDEDGTVDEAPEPDLNPSTTASPTRPAA